jgi:protein-L-isoaspartate(D-aspartate) O-methyltransferase
MMDLATRRHFFAEEIAAVANLKTPELVDALASVPREAFLGPGPWLVQGDLTAARRTADADPSHVYHNYSIAIDPDRQLFNGPPGLVSSVIDALNVRPGNTVLHVGTGLGYYTAMLAHIVGAKGRAVGIEVDPALAAAARRNLDSMPWADIRQGNGKGPFDQSFDVILVHAGVTHPQASWLDSLKKGGRLLFPLTATMPAMGQIGKGFMTLVSRAAAAAPGTTGRGGHFTARPLMMTAIYSGVDLRDETMNGLLGQAMMRTPFPRFTRLRRDAHEPGASCWLHGGDFCLAVE